MDRSVGKEAEAAGNKYPSVNEHWMQQPQTPVHHEWVSTVAHSGGEGYRSHSEREPEASQAMQ